MKHIIRLFKDHTELENHDFVYYSNENITTCSCGLVVDADMMVGSNLIQPIPIHVKNNSIHMEGFRIKKEKV